MNLVYMKNFTKKNINDSICEINLNELFTLSMNIKKYVFINLIIINMIF